MKTKLLQLSEIVTTAGTQIRASINHDSVDEYASAMIDGAKFPPVAVFHDGSEYILADGFHRVMAASRNGFKDIEAEVHKGTKSDALKYALGANATHGLKRTNADKRRSVELALSEWPKMADREVAKVCCVDHHTVASVRKSSESTGEIPQLETRIGGDGKERKMPTRKEAAQSTAPTVKESLPVEPSPAQPAAQSLDRQFAEAVGLANIPPDIAAHMEGIKDDWDYIKANPTVDAIRLASLNLMCASKMFSRWARTLEVEQ